MCLSKAYTRFNDVYSIKLDKKILTYKLEIIAETITEIAFRVIEIVL